MRLLLSVSGLRRLFSSELTLQLGEGVSRRKCFRGRFRFGGRFGLQVSSPQGGKTASDEIRQTCSVARRYWVRIDLENDQYIQQPMNRRRISRLFGERYQKCAPLCEAAGDL